MILLTFILTKVKKQSVLLPYNIEPYTLADIKYSHKQLYNNVDKHSMEHHTKVLCGKLILHAPKHHL